MRSILLQLHLGEPLECVSWTNIPVAHGVQITIYAPTGNAAVENCARSCFEHLEQTFKELGGKKTLAPCFKVWNQIFEPHTCSGAVEGLHQRILVYIGDGSQQISSEIEKYFSSRVSRVLPILDDSIKKPLEQSLPYSFSTRIGEIIQRFNIAPIIPKILRISGILSERLNLFISYKHSDAAPIASQLFHALSERAYSVFLDRFSSMSGDDFVPLIREELVDKACVLVLETKEIGSSAYCHQEVATSIAFNLGLMAIDLPGSLNTFPCIQRRLDLQNSSLTDKETLDEADLNNLVNFIEQNYYLEISRRFRAQDETLLRAILASGLQPKPVGIGQYRVNNGQNEYVLCMSRRPPGIEEFLQTEDLNSMGSIHSSGVLFGPISEVQTKRAQKIAWLGKKSSIRPIDEGHTLRSLHDIALNRI